MNKRGGSNKACSWEIFLKKNKKNSMLIRDFRVIETMDHAIFAKYCFKLGSARNQFVNNIVQRCHDFSA